MLNGKKIILGVTGSIAAYKSAVLIRLLVKTGAEVQVITTAAANSFISPLTLATLSKKPALTDIFNEASWNNHVHLGRWADIMIVAPLSCNTLAKMSHGLCDNLLMAVYLSATCPIVLAPAMDEDMWLHPSTKENLARVQGFGNRLIPVDNGELASGLTGPGRMAEPEAIVSWLEDFFSNTGELTGKKILITAGPTYEALDPVRFIGNHSSGKMGIALAREAVNRGAAVTLVLGPSAVKFDESGMEVRRVTSAQEMYEAAIAVFDQCHAAIMSAAVADYTPVTKAAEKIKKADGGLVVELTKTKDILKSLGAVKKAGQVLVGFALETSNEREYALKKLAEKNADMIVLNSLREPGAGFGHDTNKITIFDNNGGERAFDVKSKELVAKDIMDAVCARLA